MGRRGVHGLKTAATASARRRASLESLEPRVLFAQSIWAYPGVDGKLLYKPLPLGDKIGDYSNVGYMAGLASIPDVPTKITVSPIAGDDQANIQNAINAVQAMTPDANGIRGAVFLNPGTYEIPGTLTITAGGVVLRGSGQGQTILLATGTEKDTTVRIDGSGTRSIVAGTTQTIADKYVPVGALSFTVPSGSTYAVGDSIMIHREGTTNWFHDIGMDQLVNPWTDRNVDMDRTITHVDGNVITIDAPITQALDVKYGGGQIWKYTASGRISNVGVEYISGRSTYDATQLSGSDRIDENHAEDFIDLDGVINGWVRNVTSEFYGYACVSVTGPSKYVTVQDSQCLDPVSVVTGGRRYSFNMGDCTNSLWQNLYTRSGRHDYVQGSEVTGPNVVVDSRSDATRADIGPHHRYSTGTLWDNIKGGQINIQNRWDSGSGHGWAGANQVVWNSEASTFIIQNVGNPASAWNWAIGNIGTKQTGDFIAPDGTVVGSDGLYDSHGTHVDTRSLFHAQMDEKLAVDNRVLRETRLGDADNYVAGDGADAVSVDAAWKTAVQTATGQTGVGFDNVTANHLVPFTFNFGIDAGSYVAGASLSLGYKSAGGSAAGDTIFFESTGRRYTWAELGVAPPTASQGAVVIDLSKLLPALQDGKLNLAVSGNTAIDWATLNFQTAAIASPKSTTLVATDDAYVDQAAPTTTSGSSTSMFTKKNGATDNRESYLRFDVTGVSGLVTNAYVKLTPTTVGVAPSSVATTFGNATGAIFNRVSFVPNDTWTEAALNWNNKPAADPFFREFIGSTNEPLVVDVTALVRAAQSGDKKLSLALSTYVDNASSQTTYATSENATAAFRPQLVIETLDAVGAVADATVRGGASAGGNFGTTTDLSVKNDTSASLDNDREAYLRFNLNGLSAAPGNAFLRMFPYTVPATLQHSAQLVTDDTWSESGITWNNKPAGSTVLGAWTPIAGQYTGVNVSSAATSAYATDKLLSVKVVSDTASSAAQVQYASREHLTDAYRPLLVSSNLKPTITDIPLVTTNLNTPVSGKWFGVWDAETPLNSLTVSATSSNTTLLPNANIALAGSGVDRTFSLTPATGKSGTSSVTITVTDAQGQQAQATFQFTVSGSAPINGDGTDETFRIVRNGSTLDVFRNGVKVVDGQDYASSPALLIDGMGGSDTLIVDYTGGNPVPAAGLSLDGNSGNDIVRLIGSSAADAVTLTAGNVAIAGSGAFAYAGGETLELQLGAGADTLAVAGNFAVTASTLLLTLSGGGTLAMAGVGTALPDFTDVGVESGTTFNLNGLNQTIDALTGDGTVFDNGAAATLTVGAQGSTSAFAGTLANGTQTLSLTKVGAGTLILSGNNTYTGATTITAGVIEAGSASSFSGLTGPVQFLGGVFRPTATQTAANVLNKWTTTFAGATGSNTGTFDVPAGVTFTLGAAGTAAWRTGGGTNAGGSFVKTGDGTLRLLTGNAQQDDPLLLNAGTIVAEHADALGRADAGVRVDMKSGTTLILRNDAGTNFQTPINAVDAGQTIHIVLDRQTPGAGGGIAHALNTLTSAGAFTLDVSPGPNVTSGAVGLTLGAVTPGGNGTFDVAANASVTVTGAIGGGASSLTKNGAGTLVLNGVNTYTGTTSVNNGALGVNGTIAGDLTNGAVVQPGTSAGLLTVNGGYTQTSAGTLNIELDGTTPATQYDQLAVTGSVTLAGQLAVNLGFTPATGQTFLVLDNAGSDAIAGTFTGLAEGSTLSVNGQTLRVSYVGGDGNDVTLTVVAPTSPPAVTNVFVSGSLWSSSFLNFLSSSGVGEATYGYAINPADQLNELPWTNLNKVSIRFSRNVNVAQANLVVTGATIANHAISAFAYDATTFTATWTLSADIANEKLLLNLSGVTDAATGAALDGEWPGTTPNAFPSGDGSAGGTFQFRLNVLPGDVNRTGGSVTGSDVTLVRNAQNFSPGTSGYNIVYDVNGSGSILGSDVTSVRNRQGFSLPANEPLMALIISSTATKSTSKRDSLAPIRATTLGN